MGAPRTWFITGAARGIGASTAAAALDAGHRVAATARSPDALRVRFGERPDLLILPLDVADPVAVDAAVAATIAHFGTIDILLNNAGYGLLGGLEETSIADVRAIFDVNLFGALSVMQAVLPHMRRQRSGHILNVTSAGGHGGVTAFSAYCATKFALEGLTESLAGEVRGLGVAVTAIAPGYVRSDFLEPQSLAHTSGAIPDYAAVIGTARDLAEQYRGIQPGDPDKVGAAIVAAVDLDPPPRWLPLGADAVQIIERKMRALQSDVDRWRDLACSTGYDAPAQANSPESAPAGKP